MPGTVRVTVLEVSDIPGPAGKKYSVQVSVGSRAFQSEAVVSDSSPGGLNFHATRPFNATFSFPVLSLVDPLVFLLLDDRSVTVSRTVLPVTSVIEKGFRDDRLPFINGGTIHVRCSFVLSEEEKAKIAIMRAKSLQRKKQQQEQQPVGTQKAPPTSPVISRTSSSAADTNGSASLPPAPQQAEGGASIVVPSRSISSSISREAILSPKTVAVMAATATSDSDSLSHANAAAPVDVPASSVSANASDVVSGIAAPSKAAGARAALSTEGFLEGGAAVVNGGALLPPVRAAATEDEAESTLAVAVAGRGTVTPTEGEGGSSSRAPAAPVVAVAVEGRGEGASSEAVTVTDRYPGIVPRGMGGVMDEGAAVVHSVSNTGVVSVRVEGGRGGGGQAQVMSGGEGDTDEAFFHPGAKRVHLYGGDGEGRLWADATSARVQSSGAMVNDSLGNAHTGTSLSQVSVLATQGDPCDGDSDSDTATSGLTRPSVPGVVADVADDVAVEEVLRGEGKGEGEREKIRAEVTEEGSEGKARNGRRERGEKKKRKEVVKKDGGGGPLGVFKGLLGVASGLSPVMKQVLGLGVFMVATFALWPRQKKPKKQVRKDKEGRLWVVQPGDIISDIVPPEVYCNPNSEFFKLNPEVCDINVIHPGQRLYVP